MSPRATDRADAARRPENAPVALVASAEKGTGPGHLAASPLRDRTNVRAAAAEASPSSDAVAESEEEDDSGPARSRRPFGVPVGAANRAVLEQMLRRDAPTRSALTRVSAEASPSGRGGAAEPPRARPTDESPVEPRQRESRRKRRRRRSPRGSREEEEEEDASMARRGKRRNASSPSFETAPSFEVADGAGDVSEHSDASHDRTAGVHGFNFQELRGDAYGRGRRRRDGGGADRVARRIAARRRGALGFRRTRTRTRTRTTRRRSNRSKATARGAFSWMPPATISTMPTASTSKTKTTRAYARERRVLEIRRIFQRLFFQRLVRLARGGTSRRGAARNRRGSTRGRAAKAARRDASSRFVRSRDRRQTTNFYCADGEGHTSEASRAKKRRGRYL